MITIDATDATSGIDFEAFIRGGFVADQAGGGAPSWDNSSAFTGEELFFSYGTEADSPYVLAHGEAITYDGPVGPVTHTVYGEAEVLEFGTRGSGEFDADGYFTGGNVELRISGLEFGNALGYHGGSLNSFASAYMGMGGEAAFDVYADALDSEAQHFKGSDFGDTYTGTVFDDIVEGNGGADTLAGGGGDDDIDGGEGEDTALFDGPQSAYSIKKSAGGVVTVVHGDDKTTLRNVEKLKFDDATVDVADLAEAPRVVVDATASDGLDFDTYLADFFATLEPSGKSSYHGGTPDGFYGYLNGDQVSFKYQALGDSKGPFTGVVILEGEEIAYDWIHHGPSYPHGAISGAVDSLIFGAITGDEPASGPDAFTGYAAELVISGLGIDAEPGSGGRGSGNPVATLYYGAVDGDAEAFATVLAGYAQDFQGSDGDDRFTGGDFDDVIFGRLGNDVLAGGAGDDVVKGAQGDDVVTGGDGNDELFGNGGNDVLDGGEGSDRLIGGKGKDKLIGGADADTFVFLRKGDSGITKSLRDSIRDFSSDDGDKIDLSFRKDLSFIGKDGFSGDGGEVGYSYKNKSTTIVKVDLNGDKAVDMKIALAGKIALAEGDFIL